MAERPILFNGPMVRAILAGTKTQTRRVVNTERYNWDAHALELVCVQVYDSDQLGVQAYFGPEHFGVRCPFGKPGDRLWVQECWGFEKRTEDDPRLEPVATYRADDAEHIFPVNRWRPSIHMPRHLSRITLEVTGVRVERLQDISADDARAEGCPDKPVAGAEQASVDLLAKLWFHDLWAQINGQASWDANPWVWVVEFRRITP